MIPLPDHDGYAVEYEELLGLKESNEANYFSGKLRKKFSVSELLDGYEDREIRQKRRKTDHESVGEYIEQHVHNVYHIGEISHENIYLEFKI